MSKGKGGARDSKAEMLTVVDAPTGKKYLDGDGNVIGHGVEIWGSFE